jgi:hypothetical protein
LKETEKELARIAYITNQSLRFHRQQSAPIEMDVVETLRELIHFYEPRISAANITLDLDTQRVPELCQGRSKTMPVGRSKSRPVVGSQVLSIQGRRASGA